ncbi:MAG: hypothetical protein ND866_15655 [Pyrinomonadaceae bacterium]|nr:hypothetical protein [Pyrinomonadaceae bacterium]
MTPQSQFMVVATIEARREPGLRLLLGTMNAEPGIADPRNVLLPFGEFDRLHYARLVILEDATLGDIAAHGLPTPSFQKYLVFMGDCDGTASEMLADLSQRADVGLRKIFGHCDDFGAQSDVLTWMMARDMPVAVNYVNWLGRTVRQIKQESALQRVLSAKVPREAIQQMAPGVTAQQVRRDLIAFVDVERRAGRLTLTPPEPTPFEWLMAKLFHLIAIPLVGLIALPLIIVLLPFVVILLRKREKSDPEIYPRPDPQALQELRELEDRDVTNQFSSVGSVKPGLFRRWLLTVVLVLINYACRHIFNRGHLGRVRTIHFARWVFIDNKARMVFASSYDGGHEAYMDDFVNKVAWGLNLVFSNGIGWPHTDWLIKRGARFEQRFKYFQRRHHIPSQVWYKAYPGLTLTDLKRNQHIREGLECAAMTDTQALTWLRLL